MLLSTPPLISTAICLSGLALGCHGAKLGSYNFIFHLSVFIWYHRFLIKRLSFSVYFTSRGKTVRIPIIFNFSSSSFEWEIYESLLGRQGGFGYFVGVLRDFCFFANANYSKKLQKFLIKVVFFVTKWQFERLYI